MNQNTSHSVHSQPTNPPANYCITFNAFLTYVWTTPYPLLTRDWTYRRMYIHVYTLRSLVLSMPLTTIVPLVFTIFYKCMCDVYAWVFVRHRQHSASLIITSCKITVLPNYNYVELSGTMKTVSSIHSCVHFKRPKLDLINTHSLSLSPSAHMSFRPHLFLFHGHNYTTVQTHTCTHT